MSRKPIKKGDQKKAWNIASQSKKRTTATREKKKAVLICCEGYTEKWYFESIEVTGIDVEAIGLGQSKNKLVETTITKKKKKAYDQVWVVFDMDAKGEAGEQQDFDTAIVKAIHNDIKVAYSNDAFELWYYLHLQYTDEQHHRTFYYEKLSDFCGFNYATKGKKRRNAIKLIEKLKIDANSSKGEAIKRARKLHEERCDLPPHQQNPVTIVFALVEELEKN